MTVVPRNVIVLLTSFGLVLTLVCVALTGKVVGADQVEGRVFRQIDPAKANEITFVPCKAKYLRFKIYSSLNGSPAIDEFLVYGDDESVNLARNNVKKVDASSCIKGYAIHCIENLVDGKFGNDASWVAEQDPTRSVPQWISIEWNEPTVFSKVVYSRDRVGVYADRVPLDVSLEISDDGKVWKEISTVYGTIADLSVGGLTEYGSQWLTNAPSSPRKEWAIVDSASFKVEDKYSRHLQEAFLAEENALLKCAGFADCDRGLIQRHYPEFVEPLRAPENIVSLPTLTNLDVLAQDQKERDWVPDALWDYASSGSVQVFAPGNFAVGPVMEQLAQAIIVGESLYLRISGNRFLSENIAIVSSENLPVRGFVAVRDGKIVWRQIDPFDGRDANSELALPGAFSEETGVLETCIPLEFLPESKKRGVYVSIGIGGRNVLPGGRPVHFRPADFSMNFVNSSDENHDGEGEVFHLRLLATGNRSIVLHADNEKQTLEPGTSVELPFRANYGYVGSEFVWEGVDEDGVAFRLVGFHYDPCYRPFCQLKDALERSEGSADEEYEARDFNKRALIPGAVNPRYFDVQKYAAEQNFPDEHEDLIRYFSTLQDEIDNSSNEELSPIKRKALALWLEYQKLDRQGTFVATAKRTKSQLLLERELFLQTRLLKRELFLSNEELKGAEHILANKRNPFWSSHNYSDLFDSNWNPGGSVVSINIPFEDGRLRPELATTRELVDALNGVIRNPSLSFDATKLYYSWREDQNEYFRIYELDLLSGKTRRVSADGPFHDFWPTELPDGDLAFISTRCKKKFICWRPQAFVLFRMNKEGGDLQPLSHANLSEFAPSITEDGRILWTRSEYVDKGADYGHTLWTIRTDGTSPELTFGNTINLPQGYANGRRVPDSQEVCCILISHFGDLNGPVALLDLSKGPHDPSAIRSITPESPWPGFSARTETFREPFPISKDLFLVAHAALDRFGIYAIDRYGNRELLTIDDQIDTICPQPFVKREIPPASGVAADPELRSQGLGRFSVTNVYKGLEGQVEPGSAKYLRVCQEMPTPLAQLSDGSYQADHEPFMEYYASPVDILQGSFGWSSYVAKGVLGVVEVEKDGSVDFLAPSGKVLFFELLDENYNEIQRMRSVVQLQPGERRSCVGCHENRLSTPEGGLTLASEHESQTLVAPPWGAGPFWYERVVQPVLDKRCVECHTAETMKTNPRQIDLTNVRDENKIPASYRSLIQSGDVHYFDYTWGAGKTTKAAPYSFGTFQSKLWERLKDSKIHNVQLEPEEEQAIKCWIDLNVPLWGDYQKRSTRE